VLSPADRLKGTRHYYRCIGADAKRLHGTPKCNNPTVRGDKLDQIVWDQVRALLEHPNRVADEYRRRISQVQNDAAPSEQIMRLDREIARLRNGIDRLIDCYAGGLIDKSEFEPRVNGMKQRMSQLDYQHQAALDAANADRELSLVINRLEDFSAKVDQGLERLDWLGRREIIHTLVRRIEIDHESIEVVFRVPSTNFPPDGGARPTILGQHCTNVHARVLRAMRGQDAILIQANREMLYTTVSEIAAVPL
jgi:site-specific DNA recombinase